ncbi:MAG TPA: hypothetical protein VN682_26220 [Terriglobales bacterium]|jgi:predicted nucleic-acid-binding Zn-ribbon protein|nr:hypothetical protein [Terriglobales bacterium]
MRAVDKCTKCGSGAIAQRAMVVDRTDSGELALQLRVDANPEALVFKKSSRCGVHAFVCSSCGYVEFYADDPKALYDAFLAAQQDAPQIT